MFRFFVSSFVLFCTSASLSLQSACCFDQIHSTSDSLSKHLDSDLIIESSVLRHTSAAIPKLSQQPIRQDTYMYSNFKLPPPATVQLYLPNDQFCPETGRTVCSDVYSYPVDSILSLVLESKARKFNFTSLFVDERENDSEPQLPSLPSFVKQTQSYAGRAPDAIKPIGAKGKSDATRPLVKANDDYLVTSPLPAQQVTAKRTTATSSPAQKQLSVSTDTIPRPEPEPAEPGDQALEQLHASELHAQHQPNQMSSFDLKRLPKSPATLQSISRTSIGTRKPITSTKSIRPETLPVDDSAYTLHVLPLSAPMAGLLSNLDRQLNEWPKIKSDQSTKRLTSKSKSNSKTTSSCRNEDSNEKLTKNKLSFKKNLNKDKPIEQVQIHIDESEVKDGDLWPFQSILRQLQPDHFYLHPIGRSLQALHKPSDQQEGKLSKESYDVLSNKQATRFRRDLSTEADQEEPFVGEAPSSDNMPEEVCRSRHMYITPKMGLNDRSEWRFIVNLGDKDTRLRQVIKVDVCVAPNQPCSNQIQLPFGYSSRCKQKYIKKKLLALDPDGRGTSSENFFIPSCCVCEIVKQSI